MMRVLVCGGRDYSDVSNVNRWLDAIDKDRRITVVISGVDLTNPKGADYLAYLWAKRNRREPKDFPAAWSKLGHAAGPRRNQQMIDNGNPELVVAFPGGTGTADMIRRALAAQLRIIQITA
jgi:hypothetical protein